MTFETITMFFATLLAPIGALTVKKIWDNKNISSISSARKKAISRTWDGSFIHDPNTKENKAVPVQFSLSSQGKIVKGTARYNDSTLGETEVMLRGGFYSDSLLKLDFRNSHEHKLHFGVMILQLNANSDQLEGSLVSYGRDPDGIFTSQIDLRATI